MTDFTFGQNPTMTTITSNGEMQLFDSAGAMASDLTFMGDNTFTFSGTQSYSVSGTTTVSEKNGNATATLTRTNLTRSGGCCRPTSGSISVNRQGGILPGQADLVVWSVLRPGERNGTTATMPSCLNPSDGDDHGNQGKDTGRDRGPGDREARNGLRDDGDDQYLDRSVGEGRRHVADRGRRCMTKDPGLRRMAEDATAAQMAGAQATPSYQVLGDSDLKDRAAVRRS